GDAQSLAALKQFTAKFHDVDVATGAGYGLLKAPPATAQDGCISDPTAGGMGYHYTRGDNLADNTIDLLNPEFLVYAPKNGPRQHSVAITRLGAVAYFLPLTPVWPGPTDPTFTHAASLRALDSTSHL